MRHNHLRHIAIALALTAAIPHMAATTSIGLQPTPSAANDPRADEPTLTTQGSQVHITGAAGLTLEVYNLAGVRVATVRIDTEERTIALNLTKGCYILRVGKVVRKISIK